MQLVETKIYFTKVGLFCHLYNQVSPSLFGDGRLLPYGNPVMFDHRENSGWNIFTLLSPETYMYIAVPDDYLDDHITETNLLQESNPEEANWINTYNYNLEHKKA